MAIGVGAAIEIVGRRAEVDPVPCLGAEDELARAVLLVETPIAECAVKSLGSG